MGTVRVSRSNRSRCDLVANPALRRRANEKTDRIAANFPSGMARPALRALFAAGITDLRQLAQLREADLAGLHGIGPRALTLLRDALHAAGLRFKRSADHGAKEVTMGTINRLWHQKNRMPANATPAQRVAWHKAHAQHCACRPIPKGVVALMKAGVGKSATARSKRAKRKSTRARAVAKR
jgi:hypothetical protein